MQENKRKREYVKPSMKVYPMRQTPQLLAGSAGLRNYNWNDYEEE
jgi:hypothetical protein